MFALRAEDESKDSGSILSLIGKMFDFTSLIECDTCMIMYCMIKCVDGFDRLHWI
jgi:hypothetical protein